MWKYLIIFAIFSATNLFASAPDTAWTRTFEEMQYGNYVQQSEDGGYIIPGSSLANFELALLKTDSLGNKEWCKTFGGGKGSGYCIQHTQDSGYVITGFIEDNVVLLKTDSLWNEEWRKSFGGDSTDIGLYVQQTVDKGYIIIGNTHSYGAGNTDIWLIKTDSLGNKEWDKTFGGEEADYITVGNRGQQTKDGGYIITGITHPYDAGRTDADVWLIKTDSLGNKVWDKTFGGTSDDYGSSIQQTQDGGYIVIGDLFLDIWLIKTDSLGNKVWDKTFGGSSTARGQHVHQMQDDGYIIAGWILAGGRSDCWIIRTDSSGDTLWTKIIGDTSTLDEPYCMQPTRDGGYIISGWSHIKHSSSYRTWLVKLNSETGIEEGELTLPQDFLFSQNTPNPFPQYTEIKFGVPENANINVSIYSLIGKKVKTLVDEPQNAGYYTISWNGTNDCGKKLGAGVYFTKLSAKTNSKIYVKTEKICLIR